tara:strand:- start:57 stop:386 length:330 start_codon:yes stop_codon:yes gene_type:complete
MSEEDIHKYRQISLKFIELNKSNLINIYLKHLNGTEENEGEGVLFINLNEYEKNQKIDVSFVVLKILSDELIKKINECKEKNDEYIIYFILITPYEEKIIEIDSRTLTN